MKILFALPLLLMPAWGQLVTTPNEVGMSMGHIHLNVSDIDAQKKFWISQFDAKPLDHEGIQGVMVPGMLILFTQKAPGHTTQSTVLDHFGFKVRSRDEMVASCRAAGYVVSKEFTGSEGFPNAYVIGPDGITVELQQEATQKPRAVAQHMHFLLPDFMDLRAWYINTLSMRESTRGPHVSADIPGMNLTFAIGKARDQATKDGLIDHIGFEVKGLEAYCRKLQTAGVKFDVPYTKAPKLGIAYAFFTDPKGVSIELTEGLGAW